MSNVSPTACLRESLGSREWFPCSMCAWLCLQEPAPCVYCTQVKVPKNERIRVCVRKRPINRREISKGEAGAQLDAVCNHSPILLPPSPTCIL